MGYCIECKKCDATYDINYFPEFCPYCYAYDTKFKQQLEKQAEVITEQYNSCAKQAEQIKEYQKDLRLTKDANLKIVRENCKLRQLLLESE